MGGSFDLKFVKLMASYQEQNDKNLINNLDNPSGRLARSSRSWPPATFTSAMLSLTGIRGTATSGSRMPAA